MTMWTRRAARRIIHLDGNQRFPGKIGNGMREARCDGFMNIISYRGRREHESGRDHQWIDFHLHRVSFHPSRRRRDAHQACCLAILMILGWVYSSRPAWPSSVPMPDCLSPLKGMSGCRLRCLLIQTVPELICEATAKARSRFFDQTLPPSPNSVSFARAMASSTLA